LVQAACMRCLGTECPLLTAFFSLSLSFTYLSPRRGIVGFWNFAWGFKSQKQLDLGWQNNLERLDSLWSEQCEFILQSLHAFYVHEWMLIGTNSIQHWEPCAQGKIDDHELSWVKAPATLSIQIDIMILDERSMLILNKILKLVIMEPLFKRVAISLIIPSQWAEQAWVRVILTISVMWIVVSVKLTNSQNQSGYLFYKHPGTAGMLDHFAQLCP
jgi:hypothetical protein